MIILLAKERKEGDTWYWVCLRVKEHGFSEEAFHCSHALLPGIVPYLHLLLLLLLHQNNSSPRSLHPLRSLHPPPATFSASAPPTSFSASSSFSVPTLLLRHHWNPTWACWWHWGCRGQCHRRRIWCPACNGEYRRGRSVEFEGVRFVHGNVGEGWKLPDLPTGFLPLRGRGLRLQS